MMPSAKPTDSVPDGFGNNIVALSFSFADSNTGGLKASYTGLSTTSWSQRMFEQARLTEVTVTYTASGGGGTSHKATFYVNGELYNEAAVTEGASVIFPNNPSSVGGKSFIGWATTAIVGTTDDKPSMVTSLTQLHSMLKATSTETALLRLSRLTYLITSHSNST